MPLMIKSKEFEREYKDYLELCEMLEILGSNGNGPEVRKFRLDIIKAIEDSSQACQDLAQYTVGSLSLE